MYDNKKWKINLFGLATEERKFHSTNIKINVWNN